MMSTAKTAQAYLDTLSDERKEPMTRLRNVILGNLPDGFEEIMSGMLGYVVPHSIYPQGYHCDPKQPLPFMNLASQKNFIAVYHMGVYSDPDLYQWFVDEYARQIPTKLDMGKSCVRLKNMKHIPYDLIGELASKMTPLDWIDKYEHYIKR